MMQLNISGTAFRTRAAVTRSFAAFALIAG